MIRDLSPFEHPRNTLRSLGISARRRLSQNFLCQPGVARRISELAWWPPETAVVEIGGGTGVLSDAILGRYEDLVIVELDRTLAAYLRERYSSVAGARVIEADVRSLELSTLRPSPFGVFGNLPYAITTELILGLIRERRHLAGAVVMVQREYAERLGAQPGTKAYGSLTVFAALHASIRDRFRIGAGSFHPPPQVDSTVLALEFHDPPAGVDARRVERVVRAAFAHRRKLLKSNVAGALGIPVGEVGDAVRAVAGSDLARAEALSPDQFVALTEKLDDR